MWAWVLKSLEKFGGIRSILVGQTATRLGMAIQALLEMVDLAPIYPAQTLAYYIIQSTMLLGF
jgi:hypothetical protein